MFINIGENRILNTEEVEMIEKIDDGNCQVYTHHHSYFVNLPFETLSSIINNDRNKKNKVLQDLEGVLKHTGSFAG